MKSEKDQEAYFIPGVWCLRGHQGHGHEFISQSRAPEASRGHRLGGEMNPFLDVRFHKEQAFPAAGLWTVVVVILPPRAIYTAGKPPHTSGCPQCLNPVSGGQTLWET